MPVLALYRNKEISMEKNESVRLLLKAFSSAHAVSIKRIKLVALSNIYIYNYLYLIT